MQLSTFNVYVADFPETGTTMVYNTFSGGFVLLGMDALSALRKADAGEALDPLEDALVDVEWFDGSVGIVVESKQAEAKSYRDWFEGMRSARKLHVILSVTFACNLDCTYCCQEEVMSGKMMAAATAAQTAAWLADRALGVGVSEVDIDFVGGEPLLNPDRIEQIVLDLRSRLDGSGISFRFGLITNGVFLTRSLVDRWAPLGLTRAQVTLDGDESTHSITRRAKGRAEDSFANIFRNIVQVAPRISITIKGNYQANTVHGFVPLLTKLHEAGMPQGARISFSPALATLGAPSDSASGSCTVSGSRPELMIALYDEILRAGFSAPDPMEMGPCGFHRRHTYAIDPEGHIYKCPGFLGYPEWAIGHVSNGLTARYDQILGVYVQEECGSCTHRPHCAGGCVATQWLATGRAEGINCEADFFERHEETLVQRKYLLAASDTVGDALAAFPAPPASIPTSPPVPVRRRGNTVALRILG
jgi:uncharacterized protein